MVINSNILAMNAQRQFGINTDKKKKTTEKLSSGYKINRAADDAAGLTISEKMRRQVRGLTQGSKNTQDGVSMCQIADGALEEVSEMLHRITELSIKSANGTNTAEDRQAIQGEVNNLLQEIDRVSDTTEFNERKIFKGMERKELVYDKPDCLDNDYVDTRQNMISEIKNNLLDASDKSINVDIDDAEVKTAFEYHYNGEKCINDGIYDLSEHSYTSSFDGVIDGDVTIINASMKGNFTLKSGSLTLINSSVGRITSGQGDNTIQFIGDNSINGICVNKNTNLDVEGNGNLDIGQSKVTWAVGVNGYGHGGSLYSGKDGSSGSTVNMKSGNINLCCDIDDESPGQYICTVAISSLNIDGANVSVENTGLLPNKTISQWDNCEIKISDGALIAISPDGNLSHFQGTDATITTGTFEQTGGVVLIMSGNRYEDNVIPPVQYGYPCSDYWGLTINKTTDDRYYALNVSDSYSEKYWKEKSLWDDLSIWIQSGAEVDDGMYLTFDAMNTDVLGINELDVSSEYKARKSIDKVKGALEKINDNRSKIGAQQNRLEHTYKNVTNIAENTQAAESRIRDADMAKEMVELSKQNILEQVGTSMIAQANQSNQGVLNLLQ